MYGNKWNGILKKNGTSVNLLCANNEPDSWTYESTMELLRESELNVSRWFYCFVHLAV